MTQLLEGYWGVSGPAQRAMVRSARAHLRRWLSLFDLSAEAAAEISRVNEMIVRNQVIVSSTSSRRIELSARRLERRLLLRRTSGVLRHQEAVRLASKMPDHTEDVMPTKLGNILRRYERLAGAPFGIEPIAAVPYIAQVAGDTERSYLDDSRNSMDLAVRMVLVWTVSTLTTTTLLWPYGGWLMIPLATLVLAYVSYIGTVNAAQYGTALIVVTALSRRRLYEALGVPLPSSTDAELKLNTAISPMIAGHPFAAVAFNWTRAPRHLTDDQSETN